MFYLDYAKQVGDRYILNFFADSEEDLKDVPTNKPYITRNGTNYGIPLETSVVTIIEKGVKVNYVLQNGEYIAGGDVAPVVGKLEATENKTYLAKDAKLDGYSQVVVNVQPALQEKTASANGAVVADKEYYGLSKVTVNVQPKLQAKSVTANGDVTPDASYQGLSKVTVNVQPKLQEKSATPSKAQQVISPEEGYYGLSKVTVAKIPDNYVIPTGDIEITANGTHDVSGKASATVSVPGKEEQEKTAALAMAAGNQSVVPDSGKVLSKVTITKPATLIAGNVKKDVNIGGVVGTLEPQKEEQEKTITITANGSRTVTPDAGKVLSKVTITTNVPATPTEEKTVTLALADGNQVINPTAGKNISKVTITKPETLLPENIKKGVTIAGVVGTYEAVAGE